MAKRRKRRKKAGTTLRRGTCRIVRGSVRVCVSRSGKLTVSATTRKRRGRKTTRRKGRKTTRRRTTKKLKKLKKPKYCKTKPSVRKGVCRCRLKSGKMKRLSIRYCRAPKRKGGRRKRR